MEQAGNHPGNQTDPEGGGMIELVKLKRSVPQSQIRKKKIQYGYYDRKPLTPHPVIHLSGKYLEHYGFTVGEVVEVHIESNCITITKPLPQRA